MTQSGKRSFNHFDARGNAVMVAIGDKSETNRIAHAAGSITMSHEAYKLVTQAHIAKGDVLGIARLAGIMAAKKVDQLIPLAHPLMITTVTVDFEFDDQRNSITIQSTVGAHGKTGVEMEALTAVSVAALTIYDMCKAVDKGMTINAVRLLEKTGGKSGTYVRTGR